MKERSLEVGQLPPPKPLENILDALADMEAGDSLRVTHQRDPHPLYGILRHMGYQWSTTCHAVDRYEILIWLQGMPPPLQGSDDSTSTARAHPTSKSARQAYAAWPRAIPLH